MARLLDDAHHQYLRHDAAVVASLPLSMAAWARTDTDDEDCILTLTAAASWGDYYSLRQRDPGSGWTVCAADDARAHATATRPLNAWFHACGVWASPNSRAVYLNGGHKGTDATSTAIHGLDTTLIGAEMRGNNPGRYWSGKIADAAVWNVALTDAEVAMLALGVPPIAVRPHSILAYWPLRSDDLDYVGRYVMTPYHDPGWVANPPRVFNWRRRLWYFRQPMAHLFGGHERLST